MWTACLLSGYLIGLVDGGQSIIMEAHVLHRSSLASSVAIITYHSSTVYTGWVTQAYFALGDFLQDLEHV